MDIKYLEPGDERAGDVTIKFVSFDPRNQMGLLTLEAVFEFAKQVGVEARLQGRVDVGVREIARKLEAQIREDQRIAELEGTAWGQLQRFASDIMFPPVGEIGRDLDDRP